MTDDLGRYLSGIAARQAVQRQFIMAVVRRLALDVPDFDVELLQEQLYLLVEAHPHTPGSGVEPLEQAGRDELERLLDMLDAVIDESSQG